MAPYDPQCSDPNVTASGFGDGTGLPQHVAIIMDGNGRWATQHKKPRVLGHRAGVEALRRTVRAAGERGIPYLTVFGFSTENWQRPRQEVTDLMGLLREFVHADVKKLAAEGVKVRIIGSRQGLEPDILALLDEAEARTAEGTHLNLNVAFNYGARDEIISAVQSIVELSSSGKTTIITEADVNAALMTRGLPDVDLLIRTSGEQRLSNFLLWQCAYAELVFQDTLWPDYGAEALDAALAEYARRDRRFGARKDSQNEPTSPARLEA